MITIDDKEYRNLQEQVGYLTEEIKKLKQVFGNALPDPIPGPQGEPGATGGPGPQGRSPKIGFGFGPLPTDSSFENGDLYIIRGTNNVYNLEKGNVYKKVNSAWELQLNIVGSQGPVGETGEVNVNPNVGGGSIELQDLEIDGVVYYVLDSDKRYILSQTGFYEGEASFNLPIQFNDTVVFDSTVSFHQPTTFVEEVNLGYSATFNYLEAKNNDAYFVLKNLWQIVDPGENPLVICENFKDYHGNLRFVEGSITMENITGVTFTYNKWSLSGSHLMIVIAGTVTSGVTLQAEKWCDLDLPDYVKSKIFPVFEAVVERETIQAWNNDYTAIDLNLWLLKYGSDIQINQYETPTTTKSYNFRIQFDLLIDME